MCTRQARGDLLIAWSLLQVFAWAFLNVVTWLAYAYLNRELRFTSCHSCVRSCTVRSIHWL